MNMVDTWRSNVRFSRDQQRELESKCQSILLENENLKESLKNIEEKNK
jgi:hypothetical protein